LDDQAQEMADALRGEDGAEGAVTDFYRQLPDWVHTGQPQEQREKRYQREERDEGSLYGPARPRSVKEAVLLRLRGAVEEVVTGLLAVVFTPLVGGVEGGLKGGLREAVKGCCVLGTRVVRALVLLQELPWLAGAKGRSANEAVTSP
jgi:hypothetical protein